MGSAKVSPPLPPTLLHLKLVFKPGGVKVRFTTPLQTLKNLSATTFGYLVAVAGVAPSLARDAPKIVEINAAILAVYWTRLLAAALVNIESSNAHADLPQVGEGGQLLWLTLWVDRGRLYEVVPLRNFVRLMRLGVNDWLETRGRDQFVGNGGLFVTFKEEH